ncbi:hypothetical protein B005_4352 [Nocardiopsis alba ATCC BAA-2165]|uniref:Uncharacterized protein n=1 Tax=Nocardiopsis alba (strain ATCC BAA-2165 / BE74) TaxID=1205910 RepID=J7LAP8_NOCAA|nr:hypothetical protein B005_4352 [Nocardiopsis alba ATCC BAA-2165]
MALSAGPSPHAWGSERTAYGNRSRDLPTTSATKRHALSLSTPPWAAPREHLTGPGSALLEHRRTALVFTAPAHGEQSTPDMTADVGEGTTSAHGFRPLRPDEPPALNSPFPDFSENRQIRHSMLARSPPGANSSTFLSQ